MLLFLTPIIDKRNNRSRLMLFKFLIKQIHYVWSIQLWIIQLTWLKRLKIIGILITVLLYTASKLEMQHRNLTNICVKLAMPLKFLRVRSG